jgi:hypothetical protein
MVVPLLASSSQSLMTTEGDHPLRQQTTGAREEEVWKAAPTDTGTAGVIEQPHPLRAIAVGFLVAVLNPVDIDEVKPGLDLLDDMVERLLVLGVVRLRLLTVAGRYNR